MEDMKEEIINLKKQICELKELQNNYTLTNDIKIALSHNIEENKKFQAKLESKLDEILKQDRNDDSTLMLILNNKYIFIIVMTVMLAIIYYVDKGPK